MINPPKFGSKELTVPPKQSKTKMEEGRVEGGDDREIEVRDLTGKSIALFISSNKTVADLKILLRESFAPASTCPHFHLFHKGIKLNLQSKLNTKVISDAESVVLVPFAKKNQQKSHQSHEPVQPLEEVQTCEASNFAESTWLEMMQDLSFLQPSGSGDGNEVIGQTDSINQQLDLKHTRYSTSDKYKESNVASENEGKIRKSTSSSSSSRKQNEAKRRRSNSADLNSCPVKQKCHETNPLQPMEMVEHLRKHLGSQGQVMHVEKISARVADYVEIPDELSDTTKSALRRIGVIKLYSHQAKSIQASLAGKSVVVATMTSSGKSVCYNVPVLEVLSQDLNSCALYLFPTKALAQDQLRVMSTMFEGLDFKINIGIYDGDTSQEYRIWLRENARLLITNPDMLHTSILPFHDKFRRILSNLRFIIFDEAHAYKGAFGCHAALILRRLLRLCSHIYGSCPSFVFCTATSGNPREHAMKLANLSSVELIQNDGSPSGPKYFVLWNPPQRMMDKTKSIPNDKESDHKVVMQRGSPILEMSSIFAEIIQHGLRCIAFCKSRKLCELVLSYTREILQQTAPHLVHSVCAYRAGYIAEDRRKIESEFFAGKVSGVAATNALELGIDVGHIDVTLHLGFPGSIASLWQQAGRSGRREKPSLSVYVAFDGPLDQYFMKFPQKLFGSPIESCPIDARNNQVVEQHLACAAFEHPLNLHYDEAYFGTGLEKAVLELQTKGFLKANGSHDSMSRIWSYIGPEKIPSRAISIRAIESERYKVIDKKKSDVLEEIEESRAFFQVYEGAVYLHQGKTYLVTELDTLSKTAFCQETDLQYYTRTRDYTDIEVSRLAYRAKISSDQFPGTDAQTRSCKVTTTWFGFNRIQKRTNKLLDTVELSLPKYTYESQAVWIDVSHSIKAAIECKGLKFRAGLHAASHALLNIVPKYIICNSSDLASECINPHDTRYIPERILLYDQRPGGTGVSKQLQYIFVKLLNDALELLESCCCSGEEGCPGCVQSLVCKEYNEILHKEAAIMIIKDVLNEETTKYQDQNK